MRVLTGVRRLFGALAAVAAFGSPLWAQAGSVTGQVTDRESSQPIPTARLQVAQTGKVVPVRFDGRFQILDLAPGSYDVRVIAVGYASERQTVTVTAGQATTLNFALAQVPYSLEEIVTTATGEQRRLELGHTVGTIRADSVTSFSPVNNLASLLQARTAGVALLQQQAVLPSLLWVYAVLAAAYANLLASQAERRAPLLARWLWLPIAAGAGFMLAAAWAHVCGGTVTSGRSACSTTCGFRPRR